LVLSLIEAALSREERLALVVSALGESTDWLLEAILAAESGDGERASASFARVSKLGFDIAALELHGDAEKNFCLELKPMFGLVAAELEAIAGARNSSLSQRGVILAIGEVISATLLASALRQRGVEACSVDARDFLVADGQSESARIDWPETLLRFGSVSRLWETAIPVVTGFIARTRDGKATTLGRNGSDYTAALLAALLGAKYLTVWTDVPGVMTADPALVSEAVPVERLSYDEALELAYFGTRMFHPRTIIPLREYGATLFIRSTLEADKPGTRIDASGNPNPNRPTCVTSLERLSLLSVQSLRAELGRPISGLIVSVFAKAGVRVWLSTESTLGQTFSVVVPQADEEKAMILMRTALGVDIGKNDMVLGAPLSPVTMVTLVGQAMGLWPNVAGRFLGALGRAGVPVRAISQGASQRSISCVVDGADTTIAVRTVHAAFNFAHAEISAFVLGKGTVGSSLFAQLHQQRDDLRHHHDVHVRLVGLADRSGALFEASGLNSLTAAEMLRAAVAKGNAASRAHTHFADLARLPNPVLVDCTAADGMEDLYAQAFSLGINVVSANKKPLSLSKPKYDSLKAAGRSVHRAYHYGTTVGAALPIIETLKNLVRTGDRVTLIEGAFSGTLGFLCDRVSMGELLSSAVRRARQLGYTEPNPRDDLSGLDVARKALILARELGLAIELADVSLEPFVTLASPLVEDSEEFEKSLLALDAGMSARVENAKGKGRLLRYLARIEPDGAKVTVGPVDVESNHPAASLRGSEAFVAFYTDRYHEYPLIVRGAGAGGDVTAAGVLAEILRLAQNIKGWS